MRMGPMVTSSRVRSPGRVSRARNESERWERNRCHAGLESGSTICQAFSAESVDARTISTASDFTTYSKIGRHGTESGRKPVVFADVAGCERRMPGTQQIRTAT